MLNVSYQDFTILLVHASGAGMAVDFLGPDSLSELRSAVEERRSDLSFSGISILPAGGGLEALESLASARDYPYILKPPAEGNSRGIRESSVVHDEAQLRAVAADLGRSFPDMLAEKYLKDSPDSREFTVARIGNGKEALVLPMELSFAGDRKIRIVTNKEKVDALVMAKPVADEADRLALADLGRRAFESAGVRDYACCDIIMSGGRAWAIEVNGQPMLPDPWFDACANSADLDPKACILGIFAFSILRNLHEGRIASFPGLLLESLPQSMRNRLVAIASHWGDHA